MSAGESTGNGTGATSADDSDGSNGVPIEIGVLTQAGSGAPTERTHRRATLKMTKPAALAARGSATPTAHATATTPDFLVATGGSLRSTRRPR